MSSLYGQIITGVQGVINGLSLPGVTAVRRRKFPVILDDIDTPPVILVCPLGVKPLRFQFARQVTLEYGVLVATIFDKTDTTEAGLDTFIDVQEPLLLALINPQLPNIGAEWDVDIDPDPAFDPAGLEPRWDFNLIEARYKAQRSW